MLKNSVGILFFFFISSIAYSDQFQFVYKKGNETFYVALSETKITNAKQEVLFDDYTDNFGRISISITNGSYICNIYYQKKWWNVPVVINGNKKIKKMTLQE